MSGRSEGGKFYTTYSDLDDAWVIAINKRLKESARVSQ